METFNATPNGQLFVKVLTNTTKKVFTKVNDVVDGIRIKPHLAVSDELDNGSIDLVGSNLVWKKIGITNQFQGHVIEIYTIVHYLPKDVTSAADVKKYISDNVEITYHLKDGTHEQSYTFNENDKVELLIERTGIIYKYIKIQ